jgi:hypothetical protein
VRTYLVVIDDSAEARVALRFAARRAAKTKGNVEVLATAPPVLAARRAAKRSATRASGLSSITTR